MAVDTGLGAVLTSMPGSWTGNTVSIDLGEQTIPVVDTSHLGTSGFRTVMVGDLKEPGSVTLVIQQQGTTALPVPGDSGTLTITDATAAGGATPANWSGTAIVTNVRLGTREVDTLNTAEVDIKWDGGTGPTYTAAT